MGLPVVYRLAASQEIVEAARAYEGHRKGLEHRPFNWAQSKGRCRRRRCLVQCVSVESEPLRGSDSTQAAVGISFVKEIARLETHLSDAPGLYQTVLGEVRRAILRRFPYGLFYLEELERVVVLACLDLRRDPAAIDELVGRR